ncbi:hypothetical protein ASC64_20490 [Nocardioides sp. Root122]|uniref:hypothetical protein n=1 Tax=Nocardioides TaxID=1839 RepID=UPI0007026E58|nr:MULTISPECIES: hypothetical protein [Nocardioides]KQV72006.1 hypothetical protein ASC64_20490 [Nocardioides sp. Root122]MCK9824797.1 hypothetical protein [Nocardioides cavernae]
MTLRVLSVVLAIAATTGCSSGHPQEDPSSYSIVEEIETGIGTEVVVSVEDSAIAVDVFDEVFDDNDGYAAVYIFCAGSDVRQDDFILYGRADGDDRNIIIRHEDQDC